MSKGTLITLKSRMKTGKWLFENSVHLVGVVVKAYVVVLHLVMLLDPMKALLTANVLSTFIPMTRTVGTEADQLRDFISDGDLRIGKQMQRDKLKAPHRL